MSDAPSSRANRDGRGSLADRADSPEALAPQRSGARVVSAPLPPRSQLAWFRVHGIAKDYLTCRTWDGSASGSVDVYVAKPPSVRGTDWDGHTLDSVAYANTGGTSYYRRTATWGGDTVEQYLAPDYLTPVTGGVESAPEPYGSLILAARMSSTGVLGPSGEQLVWQDINLAARRFAFEHNGTAWTGTITIL